MNWKNFLVDAFEAEDIQANYMQISGVADLIEQHMEERKKSERGISIDAFKCLDIGRHPFGICENLEQESTLSWMLGKCVEQGSWEPINCMYCHLDLIESGMLEEVRERAYKLTQKAIGLLYAFYAK